MEQGGRARSVRGGTEGDDGGGGVKSGGVKGGGEVAGALGRARHR
jgi:hypothetical protein